MKFFTKPIYMLLFSLALIAAPPVFAASEADKIAELEKRIELLEQQLDLVYQITEHHEEALKSVTAMNDKLLALMEIFHPELLQ